MRKQLTEPKKRPEPSKRPRIQPGARPGQPSQKRPFNLERQPGAQPGKQGPAPVGSSKLDASKDGNASKTARNPKVLKTSRTSKIPRTTTASKISENGSTPGVIGHRYVAASSKPVRTEQPAPSKVKPNSRDKSATAFNSGSKSGKGQAFLQGGLNRPKPNSIGGKDRAMPQTRTPSTSNEFIEYTKAHKPVMIPLFVIVIVLVLYTCIDIGASFGKIHPGVSVQGVDVGGMTREDAATKIVDELSPVLSNAHIAIYESNDVASADGARLDPSGIEQAYADEAAAAGSDINGDGSIDKWNITAETIGAYIDGQALAEKAYLVGRQGNFIGDRFMSWFGQCKLDAEVSVSEERFNSLETEINQQIGKPIQDSDIKIEGGVVSVVDGSNGISVDTGEFIDRFSSSAFSSEHSAFVIPLKTDPMHIEPSVAQKVADDVEKAIADDVTIIHDPDTWVMDTKDLGSIVSTQVLAPNEVIEFGSGTQKVITDGTTNANYDTSAWKDPNSGYVLQAYVDQEKADAFLVSLLGPLATGGAKDAYFDTSSGEVVLVESVEGYGPDRSAAEIALQDLLFGQSKGSASKDRTITLTDMTIQPSLTTADAQAMGITERLATWTIPMSGSAERISNIKLLCSLIDNSLVAPGATWSFNGTTGERTAEKGFKTAPVIINGKHEDQLGGGICQIATCIFNAACYSGLGIEERVNHDFYIASYDDYGFADATVSWRSPDLKWVNDMSTYVLMTAVANDENVVVSFWGTKDGRTVECQRGEWRDGDKYVSITEVDPSLGPNERKVTQSGQDGRSIDIRYLCEAADGTVLHDITFHSIYSAQNEIITVGEGAAPAPAP